MGKPGRHTISLSCSQEETGAPPAVELAQPCPLYCKAEIQTKMASHSLPVGGLCHSLAEYSGPHFPDEEGTALRGQVTWNDHRWYKTELRTRPEGRFLNPAVQFLYPPGTHTHTHTHTHTQICWTEHLCQKMHVALSHSEPKPRPADPSRGAIREWGSGAGVRWPVLVGGDTQAWPCISSCTTLCPS